jgi:hypothetical protein
VAHRVQWEEARQERDTWAEEDRVAQRRARRLSNQHAVTKLDASVDVEDIVELQCECREIECERSVKVPLYVYRSLLDAGDQYVLQAGHHAFTSYRTIVTLGMMRIEERR